ncbi:MAG: hypothetical protein HC903_07135 [Methylacidiphilales bacterium]|nr:hypothetical protein [Candidatus Methylacidiphilales bacterium]
MLRSKLFVSGIIATVLFVSVAPAHAGRTNMSNGSGTNTSNGTGTNTSNNTGGNTSNGSGTNNSNATGHKAQILIQAREIAESLRAAKGRSNQAELQKAIERAIAFLENVKNPRRSQFSRNLNSGRAW